MKIIINNTSMTPIYEQIVDQIKKMIVKGELQENDSLPSVRSLSNELKISALTVKKAYDFLENEGYIQTVHGKGSYIKNINNDILSENIRMELQLTLEQAITKAKNEGLSNEEIKELFMLVLED